MPRHVCCYRDKKIGDEPIQFVSLSKTWSNLNALFSLPPPPFPPRNFQIWTLERVCARVWGKNSLNERNNHESFVFSLVFFNQFPLPFAPPIFPIQKRTFDVSFEFQRMKCTDNDVHFVNSTRHVGNFAIKSFWTDDKTPREFYLSHSIFLFLLGHMRAWNFYFESKNVRKWEKFLLWNAKFALAEKE